MSAPRRPPGPLTFTVREPSSLLEFLRARFPGSKNNTLRHRLSHHGVKVDGKPAASPKAMLSEGQKVEVQRHQVPEAPLPPGMRILWRDEHLLLVSKPSGLLTVANEKERERTAYWHLTAWLRGESGDPRARVFIVHRLDRDASGLVLFALSEAVKHKLQDHWDEVEKLYAVLVDGAPRPPQGTWRSFLSEGKDFRMKSKPSAGPPPEPPLGALRSRGLKGKEDAGLEAVTHYRTLSTRDGFSLLEVRLETGRKNQIRVHTAEAGCPVAGDDKYGPRARNPLHRLALHAWKLRLRHPVTGSPLEFEETLPRGFSRP